ncbi:PspA/IM30 family protein [Paenibacillus sp. CAU 1782]
MGILSRFKTIMASNINAMPGDDPVKAINEHMRSLNVDLNQVRAETSTVQMEERRARRALDECEAEIRKLQQYAVKSVEAGNDDDALKFLGKKAEQAKKLPQLREAYETASANAANIKKMNDKLVADMERLESLRAELQGKWHVANAQGKMNKLDGAEGSLLHEAQERINQAADEAQALAELRGMDQKKDELDEKFAQLGLDAGASSAEDELARLKKSLDGKN